MFESRLPSVFIIRSSPIFSHVIRVRVKYFVILEYIQIFERGRSMDTLSVYGVVGRNENWA